MLHKNAVALIERFGGTVRRMHFPGNQAIEASLRERHLRWFVGPSGHVCRVRSPITDRETGAVIGWSYPTVPGFIEETCIRSWVVGTWTFCIGPDACRKLARTVRAAKRVDDEYGDHRWQEEARIWDKHVAAVAQHVLDGTMPPEAFLDWLRDTEWLKE